MTRDRIDVRRGIRRSAGEILASMVTRTGISRGSSARRCPCALTAILTVGLALSGFAQVSHAGTVQLTWDASTQAGVTGYKVYAGTSPTQYGTPIDVGNVTTSTLTLAAGTYYVVVTAYNASGEESIYSNEITTVVASTGETSPPIITDVLTVGIGSVAATVTWTTDEPADSQVQYGLTGAYGSTSALNVTLLTAHSQVLTGLNPGTTYHFRVKSRDASGNLTNSADFTFTTGTTADATNPTNSFR